MRLDITKHTLTQTVILFFILLFAFLTKENMIPQNGTFSWEGYTSLMLGLDGIVRSVSWLPPLLSLLLLLVNAFMITRMTLVYLVFIDKNYLPPIIFLILCSATSSLTESYMIQIIIYLMLAATDTILHLYRHHDIVKQAFLASVYIGIASLLFAPISVILVALVIYLMSYRALSFKALIASAVGLALPCFICCYIFWVTGSEFTAFIHEYERIFFDIFLRRSLNIFTLTIEQYVFIAIIVFMTIYGFLRMAMSANSANITTVRSYVGFVWILIGLCVILVLAYNTSPTTLPLLSVPLSIIISQMLKQTPNMFIKDIIALALLITSFLI